MIFLLSGLSAVLGLISLVCFILIIIKMFNNGDATLGIICLVTLLCAGLGGLIALIMGWVNSDKYDARQIMMIWTGCILGNIVLSIAVQGMAAAAN